MKNNLKVLRAMHSLTQEELAVKLGISRPALSDIENSKSIPSGRLMIRIANHFGIPAEQIFFEDDVQPEKQTRE